MGRLFESIADIISRYVGIAVGFVLFWATLTAVFASWNMPGPGWVCVFIWVFAPLVLARVLPIPTAGVAVLASDSKAKSKVDSIAKIAQNIWAVGLMYGCGLALGNWQGHTQMFAAALGLIFCSAALESFITPGTKWVGQVRKVIWPIVFCIFATVARSPHEVFKGLRERYIPTSVNNTLDANAKAQALINEANKRNLDRWNLEVENVIRKAKPGETPELPPKPKPITLSEEKSDGKADIPPVKTWFKFKNEITGVGVWTEREFERGDTTRYVVNPNSKAIHLEINTSPEASISWWYEYSPLKKHGVRNVTVDSVQERTLGDGRKVRLVTYVGETQDEDDVKLWRGFTLKEEM